MVLQRFEFTVSDNLCEDAKMRTLNVQSSAFHEAAYDDEKQELHVVWKNGSKGIYHDVPESIVSDLQSSNSAGAYIRVNIRDKFRYTKK